MFSFLLIVQIMVSVAIITLVMMQQGKGADMGAAFGSGASGTVFGSRGGGSFFTRATGILAMVFFINCLLIASPLVQDNSSETDSIASQLEESAKTKQLADDEAALVEKLEEATTGQANDLLGDAMDDADTGAAIDAAGVSDLPE